MKRTGRSLAELASGMPQFPQVMVNVRVRERIDPRVRLRSRTRSGGSRRRSADRTRGAAASGTEPLIRVMVEGQDEAVVSRHAHDLAETVRRAV